MTFTFSHPALLALQQQLDDELDHLCLPEAPWMPERSLDGNPIRDVAIIGGGMAGLTAAAALKFAGIANTHIYDSAPAGSEGPWATHARMQTLRSPKHLTGPALGIPALTFRTWYTRLHGKAAWDALDRIPRLVWHEYLQWYRQALGLPVNNHHRLENIEAVQVPGLSAPISRLTFSVGSAGTMKVTYARHVVLATGMDGLGGANIPPAISNLDQRFWRHSSEVFDFQTLASKRIAIVGGGDSALDAASTALEAGAQRVDIYVRAEEFSQINYWKGFTHSGHRHGYAQLSEKQKTQTLSFLLGNATPPARGTLQRLRAAENFFIHFGQQTDDFQAQDGKLHFQSNSQQRTADFLILATGYRTDLTKRPELNTLLPHIRFFAAGELGGRLPEAAHTIPRLNLDFSFQSETDEGEPLLSRVHCFTGQALLSVGKICGDIPGISAGAQRLTQGIAAKLYEAEHAWHYDTLTRYSEQEVNHEDLQALRAQTTPDEESADEGNLLSA